jgi:quercetin dioxygenase-like cupin family protein
MPKRILLAVFLALSPVAAHIFAAGGAHIFAVGGALADPPAGVELRGFHAKVAATLAEFGHLAELNGKYQLRVTQVTYDPDGMMGHHHHLGPGVRCVTAGELTYTMLGKTTIYRAGDCFTETGDVSHDSVNAGGAPVVLLNFEILPVSLPASKGSLIPIPK